MVDQRDESASGDSRGEHGAADVRRAEPAWVKDAIWWQVFPMGFTGADMSGRDRTRRLGLRHIEQWLDYAVELGASGILLGPILESSSHGYDTIDYLRIDPRLGDESDFDSLISAAHSKGMRVLLDGVFNHIGRESVAFQSVLSQGLDSPYAEWFHLTWPADSVPGTVPEYNAFEGHGDLIELNHDSPAVVKLVADVMDHWLDRGADGWRLDAAYAVDPQFWAKVLPGIRRRHPDAYFVGEVIHGDYTDIVKRSGLDAVTQYELWKAIWSSINDANFFELAWSLERHDEYLERFVPLTFLGNHDVTRIASKLTDERHLPHALVVLATVGGTPSVYYGDEQAFRGVKEERFGGDDEIRPAFPDSPDDLAPFGQTHLALYEELIGLRRRHRWLHAAHTETVQLTNERFSYRTSAAGESLEVSLNLTDDPWVIDLSARFELLASDPTTALETATLTIGPHGWAICSPIMVG
ncbi:MAG: alpha-amylase [Actinobacteria bacterium]|nr:alpha-amylase [Actinomycetota bacterium]